MRLIDADALDRKIAEMTREPAYQHTGEDWLNGLCMAMEAINESPTVDAAVMPCKPGDTVFFIRGNKIKEGLALSVQYHLCGKPIVNIRYDPETTESTLHYLGLKAFMTREEAEAALAKMKEGA